MLFSRYSNLPTAHRAHPAALRDESLAPDQACRAPQPLRVRSAVDWPLT